GARIIAAADAYHAIRSDRPYRSGRTHREAVCEIRRCSGGQFDPHIVDTLFDVLQTDERLRELLLPESERLRSEGPPPSRAVSPAATVLSDRGA
ncbi:MAG: hypothetical protein JW990_07460, partial [Thermoleophilia bacterium]|nr:hypothetical protein [Thermoleophilia bacterium]